MMPAHKSGAAVSSSKPSGSEYAYRSIDDRGFRVAAVVVPSREARLETQVLVTALTEAADATRAAQPRDADAIADLEARRALAEHVHPSDDLVTRDDARAARQEVALGQVEICPADAADVHSHPHLACRGQRRVALYELQGLRSMGPGASTTQARTVQPPGTICGASAAAGTSFGDAPERSEKRSTSRSEGNSTVHTPATTSVMPPPSTTAGARPSN